MHIIIPEIIIGSVCAAKIHVKGSVKVFPEIYEAKPYPGLKVKQLYAWVKIVSFSLDRKPDKEI
jgi:hypothetical protein